MDGPVILHNCILGFDKCSNTAPCPLHDQFIGVRDQLTTVLKTTTISEVVESYSKGDTILQLIQEK
jgi:DNA-binding IscR family transcriptional regulator